MESQSIIELIKNHPKLSTHQEKSLLFILVRHRGCTFCRESLSRLTLQLNNIIAKGLLPVVVHMGDDLSSELMQKEFQLKEVLFISDPQKKFYKALSARRGSFNEVLGLDVLKKGIFSGALFKYGIGPLEGDGFQLGGIYLVQNNKTTVLHRPVNAADTENWDQILLKV